VARQRERPEPWSELSQLGQRCLRRDGKSHGPLGAMPDWLDTWANEAYPSVLKYPNPIASSR